MMHCDYQLAHCPITYILALAHADRAFKNGRLTPEYILQSWQIFQYTSPQANSRLN
jgi:hypothetical protein